MFADGDAANKTFTVAICDDSLFETPDETFNATLSIGSGGATIGTPNPAAVTINDNDLQPSLQFSAASYLIRETGGTLTATVTRTGATGNAVSVNIATANVSAVGGASSTAGIDYITASGTINFASGDTSKPFSVTICNDGVFEGAENFNLTLSSPTGGAVIGMPNPANVIILNNSSAKSDFDGDGKADLSIYRTVPGGTSIWSIRESSGGMIRGYQWGLQTDIPTPADYDGDGKTDVAVFRPSDSNWYILPSSTGTPYQVGWGLSTDILVPADYDGDGRADIAVYRDGTWYLLSSLSGGYTVDYFGLSTDYPLPNSTVTP